MTEKYTHIEGAGKKSSSSRTPVEAPNTLKSNTKGKLLDLICYGPVKGLVDGSKSIFVDGTPLQNEDGTYNFEGIKVDTTLGTPDQEVIPGFRDISNPREINTVLKYGNPSVRTISNNDADAITVTVRVSSLLKRDVKSGDTNPYNVPVRMAINDANGFLVDSVNAIIKGKNTSPFERTYRLELNGDGPFTVEVSRTREESDTSDIQDEVAWTTLTEIVDIRQNYPGCVLAGLSVDAQDFGNSIPARSYLMYLREIKVPSNYDPMTRKYTGIWNGTFKTEWTDNPAWVFYDLATDPIVGVGLESVNKFALYEIGKYCDELVDDGYGGTEPRFTCNTLITGQEEAISALNSFASIFRGMAYWGAGTVEPVADMPGPIRKIITPSDVIDGEFVYEGSALRDRHSVAVVTWNDPEDDYETKPEMVEDPESINLFGWRETELTAVGCTSRGQARRLGLWALYSERAETQMVTFQTTVKNHDMRPGEYFQLQDPYRAGARFGGKIVEVISHKVIELDELTADVVAGWSVLLENVEGRLFESEILTVSGNTITLKDLPSIAVAKNGSFLVHNAQVNPQTFRVLTVAEDEGDVFTVSALEHDPRKYDIVEKGLKLPEIPTSLIPQGRLEAPSNLSAEPFTYIAGGSLHQGMTVGWSHSDPRMDSFQLEVKGPDDVAFDTVYSGVGLSFDLKDVVDGDWAFRVRAVSKQWSDSPWSEFTKTIGNMLAPKEPLTLYISVTSFSATVRPSSSGISIQEYEFWRSRLPLTVSEIETDATYLGTSTYWVDDGLQFGTEYFYYVRAVNIYGHSPWISSSATTKADVDEILDAIVGDHEKSDLGKWFNDEIEKISGEGLGSVNDRIGEVTDSVNADLGGVSDRLDGIDFDLGGLSTDVSGNTAGLIEVDNRLTGKINQTNTQVSSVSSRVDSLNSQVAEIINAPVWEDKAYGVGSLVKVGDTLYRANKAVPTGVAVTNEEYWTKIGDFESIGDAVSSALIRLDSAETTIDSITGEVSANTSSLNAMQSAVTDLNLQVSNNSTIIQELETKTSEVESTARQVNSLRSSVRDLQKNEDDALGTALHLWDTVAWVTEINETVVTNERAQASALLEIGTRFESAESLIQEVQESVSTAETTQASINTVLESRLDSTELETSGNAQAVSSLETRVTQTESGIVSESERVDGLISSVGTIGEDVATNTATIQNVEGTIASDKLAQSAINQKLTADFEGLEGGLTAQGSAISALEVRTTNNEGAITAQSSRLDSLSSDLSDVETGQAATSLAVSKLDTRVTANEDGISSQATRLDGVETGLTDVETGQAANSQAVDELTTRVEINEDGILSEAGKISIIQSSVRELEESEDLDLSNVLSNWDSNAKIVYTQDTLATAKKSQAEVSELLQAKFESNEAEIVSVKKVVSDSNSAQSVINSGVSAKLEDISGDVLAQAGVLDSLEVKVANESGRISAQATRTNQLQTELGDLSSTVTIVEESLTTEIATQASRIDGVQSELTTTDTNQKATAVAVGELDTRVTSAEGTLTAQASRIVGVESSIGEVDSRVTTVDSTLTTEIATQASRITTLNSKVDDDISAAIQSIDTTLTDKINAEASRITNVQSDLNGVSANVQNISQTLVGIDGQLTAMGGLKVQVNNKGQKYIAGIGVSISDGNTGIQSDIVMQADNFKLLNTVNGTAVSPFAVVGGVTVIKEALIQDGSIGTAKLGDTSITSAKLAGVIQSDNFLAGSRGWRIRKTGDAEFNTVSIRNIEKVDGGTFDLGVTSLNAVNGVKTDRYTGGRVFFLSVTGVPISSWTQSTPFNYTAKAYLGGNLTVYPPNSSAPPDVYWGVTVEVLPLTVWSGPQTLRLKFLIHSHNVSHFQSNSGNLRIHWEIFKDS